MPGVRALLLAWSCVLVPAVINGSLVISEDGTAEKRSTSDQGEKVEVYSVKVDCKVASRFVHTVMTTKAVNKGNTAHEAFFEVELPKTAFITNFSMEIDGKTYVGAVKEKEKAQKQYNIAVSSGQTAGLVRASGRKIEKFSVSVNVAANSNITFTLTYEELLKRKLGQYEIIIRVKPKQPVQHFEIVADVYEPQGIAFLDAYGTFISNELLPLVFKTVTATKAHVSFSPTLDQQRKCSGCDNTLIDGDFFIKYDVKRAERLGDIQIVNGYFVHFFAPADLPQVPKNVMFVIDISISMEGDKIRQTREALLAILNDLKEEDYFGLLLFDDQVRPWRPSLSKATAQNLAEAKAFVRTIVPIGYTDINAGVLGAVGMLKKDTQNKKLPENGLSMIILLTDGTPSSGVQQLPRIQENVRSAIEGKMTLFCLAFGRRADYGFLDVMAQQNQGLARKIYEESDATLQLENFYDEIATPLLLEVQLNYGENAVDSLTDSHFKQLFNGSEIVVAGRLSDNDLDNFLVEVSGKGLDQDFAVQAQASAQKWDNMFPEQEYIFKDFTERLWAYLTIQQLLDKRESGPPEEKAKATQRALELSLQYSFVTPLTSMVVTKPQEEEKPEEAFIADKLTEYERDHPSSPGKQNVQIPSRQHTPQWWVDGDPHFIVEIPEKKDALCFNIDDKPGTIFNLVRDPLSGMVVNGQTIGNKKVAPGDKTHTYFGRFGIVHPQLGVELEVTTRDITIWQHGKWAKLFWIDTALLKGPKMDLEVTKERSLTLTLRNSATFVIRLHRVWKRHPYHQDYLGFYTLDSHLLSPAVHGLLGQFYHGVQFEVSDLYPGLDPGKDDATMKVKGLELRVTRGWSQDFWHDFKRENVPCWFIHNNGTGLVDGTHTDYIVSGLFETPGNHGTPRNE